MGKEKQWSEAIDDQYRAFRTQIEHEDHLIGMRVSWLVAAEAFLFAAYAEVLGAPRNTVPRFSHAAVHLFDVLPWVGIALAAIVFVAVCAAVLRLEELRREFKTFVGNVEGYPKITSTRVHRWPGRIPGILAPVILIVAWCLVR
jgi:hypothetical protein